MQLENAVVLVTGGNRGLGRAIAADALARGARKVYATARDPRTITDPGVLPLALEVTDPESVAEAARQAPDVTVLVNNAAGLVGAGFLDSPVEDVRREFETNFFGPLAVTRAFVPGMVAAGGGHVLNIHSVLSWIALSGSYSASKAALWSMSNSLRLELVAKGVGVTGLHVGYVDTDMAAHVDAPKVAPAEVARLALDGVEAGAFEVLADEVTRRVKAGLSADPAALYPQLARA
ncbi:SDR family oxidoreductase [Micromonospora sp. WMMD1102]|uniref:SDR family oxidoreductase n=1 Tax=Micromonospora sp. WMMD1102 TaxID=3016105 RepID=UPI002414EA1E|nr:SDR family oxidoreductase [Micromonospora sp. WMMD1102]MDG4787576.1 SDR family oxidoreductase [Micromonospora sp. WMMD1102]